MVFDPETQGKLQGTAYAGVNTTELNNATKGDKVTAYNGGKNQQTLGD